MNKKFLFTAASITVFILILVLLLSPKKSSTPAPSEAVGGVGSNIVPINLSKEKRFFVFNFNYCESNRMVKFTLFTRF